MPPAAPNQRMPRRRFLCSRRLGFFLSNYRARMKGGCVRSAAPSQEDLAPAELHSCHGPIIRRDPPLGHTLLASYTDAPIRYLPHPTAHEPAEYAAPTVPGILDLPAFNATPGASTTAAAVELLRGTVGRGGR